MEPEETKMKEKPVRKSFKDDLKLLLPNRNYAVTQLLICLNIGIYICMVIAGIDPLDPDAESLLEWGGSVTLLTIALQEYWRLLTACFLHNGLIHLLFNMYALLYIGSLLEKVIGHSRFMFAYILAGLFSSLVSCWWNFDALVVSVGASGAIFGMYGLYLALLLSNKILDKNVQKEMLPSMLIFIGYNLVYGIKDNIDNAAHICGLVFGLAIGLCFLPGLLQKGKNRVLHYVIGGVVPVVLLVSMFFMLTTKNTDNLLNEWGYGQVYDESLVSILEKCNDAFEILQELESETDAMVDETTLPLLEKLGIILKDCRNLVNEYPVEEAESSMQPFLIYLSSFVEMKTEQIDLSIKYYHSGYDPVYEPLLKEINEKLVELETEYLLQFAHSEGIEEIEYDENSDYDYGYIYNFE
ncbi:MAG: rhomboid family intramembrane serine protease [Tannerellaceae bacterium]|nr:rhomboid family intramembrane serine protease [Tannerellaceae bacterium]